MVNFFFCLNLIFLEILKSSHFYCLITIVSFFSPNVKSQDTVDDLMLSAYRKIARVNKKFLEFGHLNFMKLSFLI